MILIVYALVFLILAVAIWDWLTRKYVRETVERDRRFAERLAKINKVFDPESFTPGSYGRMIDDSDLQGAPADLMRIHNRSEDEDDLDDDEWDALFSVDWVTPDRIDEDEWDQLWKGGT